MSQNRQRSRSTVDTWIHGLTLTAIGCELLWGIIWAVPNIALRLGIWPFEFDLGIRALLPTLSFIQETLFFGGVLLTLSAFCLLAQRSILALPVFFLAILFDRTDWIIMSLNPLEGTHFSGKAYRDFFFLTLQLSALAGLVMMTMRGTLKAPATVDRALRRLFR